MIESDIEDEAFESIVKDGSKWDKSNSDCKFLNHFVVNLHCANIHVTCTH